MPNHQYRTSGIRPARRLQHGVRGSSGCDGGCQGKMVGKGGNGLLGAGRGADQNAVVVGQMLMQKSGDFPGLLDTLRGEVACVVGGALVREKEKNRTRKRPPPPDNPTKRAGEKAGVNPGPQKAAKKPKKEHKK